MNSLPKRRARATAQTAPARAVSGTQAERTPTKADQLVKLKTVDDFRLAIEGGKGVIAIRDPALTRVHEPSCARGLQEQHFLAKTAGAKGSAGYYWAPGIEAVRARWPGARKCRLCDT
jgi:hypothetical protein